jgi:hypothetical protein
MNPMDVKRGVDLAIDAVVEDLCVPKTLSELMT